MEDQTHSRPIPTLTVAGAPVLPEGLVLFVGGGIPSVFRRLDDAPAGSENWLYLPDRVIEQLLESVPIDDRLGPSVAPPLDFEEYGALYPLVIGNNIRACLGDFRGSGSQVCIDWTPITAWLVRCELSHFHGRPSPIATPSALVTCDTTPDRLVRNALNLLVEQVPEGLAATYDERDGLYRMRTAVGNIAMWDTLEGELPHSTASRWLEGVEQGRWFLPAGFLPERPMMLTTAPDFLLIHHGMQSDKMRSLVVMPVPGTISRDASERAIALLRMIAGLHENRLGMTEDLLALCSRFVSAFRHRHSMDTLLKDLFDILNRGLGLSRLVFSTEDRDCRTVLKRIQEEPVVREDSQPAIASAIRLATTTGRTFVADLTVNGCLSEEEAKRYYLDNVRSEFCFRLAMPDSPDLLVAFGTSEVCGRLRKAERLLEVTVSYLQLYQGYLQLAEAQARLGRAQESTLPMGEQRLPTIATLADGHFHSMFDTLSWMLGETELSGAGTDSVDSPGPLKHFTRAVERLVAHLDQVRRLLHDAPESSAATTPVHRLLTELPAVFEGYAHWLQDTKSIAVRIEIDRSAGPNFGIKRGQAYDFLYPVITSIMNSAAHSGEIRLRSTRLHDGGAIELSCARDLTGCTSLRAVIEQWSGQRFISTPGGPARMTYGDSTWECSSETEEPQRAWLSLAARSTDRNSSGQLAAPKTEVR